MSSAPSSDLKLQCEVGDADCQKRAVISTDSGAGDCGPEITEVPSSHAAQPGLVSPCAGSDGVETQGSSIVNAPIDDVVTPPTGGGSKLDVVTLAEHDTKTEGSAANKAVIIDVQNLEQVGVDGGRSNKDGNMSSDADALNNNVATLARTKAGGSGAEIEDIGTAKGPSGEVEHPNSKTSCSAATKAHIEEHAGKVDADESIDFGGRGVASPGQGALGSSAATVVCSTNITHADGEKEVVIVTKTDEFSAVNIRSNVSSTTPNTGAVVNDASHCEQKRAGAVNEASGAAGQPEANDFCMGFSERIRLPCDNRHSPRYEEAVRYSIRALFNEGTELLNALQETRKGVAVDADSLRLSLLNMHACTESLSVRLGELHEYISPEKCSRDLRASTSDSKAKKSVADCVRSLQSVKLFGLAVDGDTQEDWKAVQRLCLKDDGVTLFRPLGAGDEATVLTGIRMAKNLDLLNTVTDGQRTLLHVAAARGLSKVCVALLESSFFTSVNACDGNGWTALHFAAMANQAHICSLLLSSPRFLLAAHADELHSWTALHCAARSGNRAATEVLLQSPGFRPVTARDDSGQTVLHSAASSGSLAVVQSLVIDHRLRDLFDVKDCSGKRAFELTSNSEIRTSLENSQPRQ